MISTVTSVDDHRHTARNGSQMKLMVDIKVLPMPCELGTAENFLFIRTYQKRMYNNLAYTQTI